MPGPILLKCHVLTNKVTANPQCAHVQYADSPGTTVSLSHLASLPEDTFHPNNILPELNIQGDSCCLLCDEQLNEDVTQGALLFITATLHLPSQGVITTGNHYLKHQTVDTIVSLNISILWHNMTIISL